MRRDALTGAIALAALALSSCSPPEGIAANTRLCADFKVPAPTAAAAAADPAAPVEDCLRRWAYALAGSRDGADMVADASVAACGAALGRWNEAALAQQGGAGGGENALSLTTGEPTNALAEHGAYARSHALLYVVEARAGKCAAPPMASGAPVGV